MSSVRSIANWVALVLRVGLAFVFAFAATVKLGFGPWASNGGPEAFAFSIKGFKMHDVYPWLMPDHVIPYFAFFVPWLELVCAVLLLIGLCTRASALVLGGMLIAFMGAIYSVLSRDMSVHCGCFGNFAWPCEKGALGPCNLILDAVLLSAVLIVWVVGPGYFGLDRCLARFRDRASSTPPSPEA